MEDNLKNLGRWPVPWEEARKGNRMIYIPGERWLRLIHGKKNHILVSFFVSNDFCHFGKLQVSQGTHSDPEIHGGDEVLFVLKGMLTVQVYEKGESEATVLHETYEVREEEQFLIPEGMKHRYLNFSDRVVEAIFGIAPAL